MLILNVACEKIGFMMNFFHRIISWVCEISHTFSSTVRFCNFSSKIQYFKSWIVRNYLPWYSSKIIFETFLLSRSLFRLDCKSMSLRWKNKSKLDQEIIVCVVVTSAKQKIRHFSLFKQQYCLNRNLNETFKYEKKSQWCANAVPCFQQPRKF